MIPMAVVAGVLVVLLLISIVVMEHRHQKIKKLSYALNASNMDMAVAQAHLENLMSSPDAHIVFDLSNRRASNRKLLAG